MNIPSLDPDSMKEEQTQRDIVKNPTRAMIHISDVREKHIIRARYYRVGNYRITPEAATKS